MKKEGLRIKDYGLWKKLIATVIPAEAGIQSYRHCEERSDAAISYKLRGYNG
jgi:hypothetical protein